VVIGDAAIATVTDMIFSQQIVVVEINQGVIG
jgi:hypothetical protein